jgi:phage shock protein A
MSQVIKSNLNSLIDKAEDPEKMIAHTVDEMEVEIKKARKEVLSTVAAEKGMAKKRDEHLDEARRWEDKAMLALKSGDEELAREALRRKAKEKAEADRVEEARRGQDAYAYELRSSLDQLERKVEDLKLRKQTIASQVRQARTTPERAGGSASRFGSKSLEDLERMSSRIEQFEAEVEAHSVLEDPRRAELDRRFAELEKDGGVDDELAALKAKLRG